MSHVQNACASCQETLTTGRFSWRLQAVRVARLVPARRYELPELRHGHRGLGDPVVVVQGLVAVQLRVGIALFSHPEGPARHGAEAHLVHVQQVPARLPQACQEIAGQGPLALG